MPAPTISRVSTLLPFDAQAALRLARETLRIEADAILGLIERLGEDFARAVELILSRPGRVVVMGMGKSGHVGRKIAATLASTGTPAFFVHPAEASHGDLGMVTASDVVLAISNSGEVAEITAILPAIKRLGVPLIAVSGRADSELARHAELVLDSRARPTLWKRVDLDDTHFDEAAVRGPPDELTTLDLGPGQGESQQLAAVRLLRLPSQGDRR